MRLGSSDFMKMYSDNYERMEEALDMLADILRDIHSSEEIEAKMWRAFKEVEDSSKGLERDICIEFEHKNAIRMENRALRNMLGIKKRKEEVCGEAAEEEV